MNAIINEIRRDPFEAFGYLILAIGCTAFVIRYAKHAWKSIVNDED